MGDAWAMLACGLLLVLLGLELWRLIRDRSSQGDESLQAQISRLEASERESIARLQTALFEQIAQRARESREELSASLERASAAQIRQLGTVAQMQGRQIDGFAEQLARLTQANEQRLAEIRQTLETKLSAMQHDNAQRLEQMRVTVDEKLQATLEQRLGQSFQLVSERLEQVHRGLGEMQALAADVGDLKRVLSNVKTRGTWGEVQLAALIEQMLVPEQYATNVATVPGSGERVEFALRLPGAGGGDPPVWLPIDSKFPREDYERLQAAQDAADALAAEQAAKQLAVRVREQARTIRDKYVSPPATTDFAILFLATEGLYAEVVRRPGLHDELQRLYRVVVAGPTTLAAILSSLQMGFRTLAVERRSSEVWQLLGAVKTEFGKFGDLLAKTRQQLDRAVSTLGSAETRTRQIERQLRSVTSLPAAQAQALLTAGDSLAMPSELDASTAEPPEA